MYLFIDTETTGLDEEKGAIIQIAALQVSDAGDVQAEFSSRVRPFDGALIEGRAFETNRRRHSELLDAPTEHEVCMKLRDWNGRNCFVFAGYNCAFDQKFVWKMFQRTGVYTRYAIPKEGPMDVLKEARALLKKPAEVADHKLVTVAKHFGVLRDGAHDALEDIRMTRDVWKCLKRVKQEIKEGKR